MRGLAPVPGGPTTGAATRPVRRMLVPQMYRYDYVLRLIERLGQLLRTVRDRMLQRRLSDDDVRHELHDIAREAGLDVAFARRLDPATLVTWLAPIPDRMDTERVWLMAELLHVEGLAARETGDTQQADADLRRALALFEHIAPTWKPTAEDASAADRVAELQALLSV